MPDGYLNPTVEDCYDSDEKNVSPEARRNVGKQPPSTKPMPPHFHGVHRDAASDSGYSSHTSNTVSSTSHSHPAVNLRPPPPPTTQHAAPNHSKPVNTRSDSQRHQSRTSRSASMSQPPPPCNCDEPGCTSKKSEGRAYALPHRPQSQHGPQHPQTTQYPVQNTAPYSQPHGHPYPPAAHGQQGPGYSQHPQARPHASSTSRSRPPSWAPTPGIPIPYQHGMAPQGNYNVQHHGLQPSPSAYNRSYMGHHQSASGDWSATPVPMASGSPHDPYGSYMQGRGVPIPSNGQPYRPSMHHAYSARQNVPTMSSHDSLTPTEHAQPSQPIISARRRSNMPGSFPAEALQLESSSDDTSSESSDSEEEEERYHYERHQHRREKERDLTRRALEDRQERDRRDMPPPTFTRRPTLSHARTTPADARRPQSRGPPQRSRYSEPRLLTSEDVDRAARHAAEKRLTPSYERIDRRASISNQSSSGRHRSGSVAHESRIGKQYVVEDAHGRKQVYNTREEAEAKARRLKQQQHLDEAEAYQATKRGNPQPAAPTVESVKRAQTHQRERGPASHVSGSSRKSTTSSARTTSESIQITRNGNSTIFNIPTNTHLEVRQTEEGETWVIGSGSPPREHSYHGGSSKSSGSRVGRRNGSDRGGRRRDTKLEDDDGYEPGL